MYNTNPYATGQAPDPYNQTYAQTNPIPGPYVQTAPYMQPGPNYTQTYQQSNPYQETYDSGYEAHTVEPAYIPETGEKFQDNGWRDIPFAILFVIHFVGIGIILGYGLTLPNDTSRGFLPHEYTDGNVTDEVAQLAILAGVAVFLSVAYMQFMKAFPRPLIYMGIVFNIGVMVAASIYFFVANQIFAAVILLIFTVISVIYFIAIRKRIPFAVEMITSVIHIVQRYPATQITAYISILVQIAWTALWVSAFGVSQRFGESSLIYVATVFLIFSYYWVFEVIKNIVHVTVSGLIATVYFMGDMMPANPTVGSFKRAVTTSFGSICLGSLIVALIKTIRTLVRMARNEENGLLVAIVDCILSCIDGLVQYFNHYAFCQVAIYGKSFCDSAKATWALFQSSGLEAIANDNLIDGVLWMGVLFNALVTGGVGALLGGMVFGTPASAQGQAISMGVAGFVIGFVIMILSMQVIDSSIACSFVCFSEDKEVLHRTNPELYQRLMETYHLNW